MKTGDVRGAEEGVSALTRSCAGQQNLFTDTNPVSMVELSPKPDAIGQPDFAILYALIVIGWCSKCVFAEV